MDSGREAMWAERRELVSRWEQSGESMAAFCRSEGIAYWKLLSWRKRLAQMDEAGSGFAELVVRRDGNDDRVNETRRRESDVDVRSSLQRALVEIALPGGACVRVFAGADAGLVREAVQAVRAC
jgi:hypothetical protein